MIYLENIKDLKQYQEKYATSDVVALKCTDNLNEVYWRAVVLKDYTTDSLKFHDFVSVDTLDELNVWCDLHNLHIVKTMTEDEYDGMTLSE